MKKIADGMRLTERGETANGNCSAYWMDVCPGLPVHYTQCHIIRKARYQMKVRFQNEAEKSTDFVGRLTLGRSDCRSAHENFCLAAAMAEAANKVGALTTMANQTTEEEEAGNGPFLSTWTTTIHGETLGQMILVLVAVAEATPALVESSRVSIMS